jgi:arylsulfatase A-like enzyme
MPVDSEIALDHYQVSQPQTVIERYYQPPEPPEEIAVIVKNKATLQAITLTMERINQRNKQYQGVIKQLNASIDDLSNTLVDDTLIVPFQTLFGLSEKKENE